MFQIERAAFEQLRSSEVEIKKQTKFYRFGIKMNIHFEMISFSWKP